MTDLAAKMVQAQILDTWSRGQGVAPYLTDLDVVAKGGDSKEIPYAPATVVNTTENASPNSTNFAFDTLTVDTFRFINEAITVAQFDLLLNGDGNYAAQLSRRMQGDMQNSIDSFYIRKLLENAALDPGNHVNLDLSASVSDDLVGDTITLMMEQEGILQNHPLRWLASPRAHNTLKAVANYSPVRQEQSGAQDFGLPFIATLDGYPFAQHQGVPGRTNALRMQSTGAATIASNVATVTLAAGESDKWTVGQLVWTSGYTADVAVGSPTPITAKTANTISFAVTAADGANGSGTVYSASSMCMLVNSEWMYRSDTGVPRARMVDRENDAGWAAQLNTYVGAASHAGAVKVLHLPD